MLELREAHRHKGTDAAPVEIGDIVVVHSDKQARGFGKLDESNVQLQAEMGR